MKRHILILSLLCAFAGLLAGCRPAYEDIRIKSLGVQSVQLTSSKTMDLVLDICVENPAGRFVVDTVCAVVKAGGFEMMTLSSAGIEVAAKTDSTYVVPVSGAIAKGVNVFFLLGALKEGGSSALTADLWAKVKLGGVFGKTLEYKDIELDKLKNLF